MSPPEPSWPDHRRASSRAFRNHECHRADPSSFPCEGDGRGGMELISPELVLIDPELAQKARALLPPPRDCLAVATATLTKAGQGDVPRPSLLVALVTLMVVTL